MKILWLSISLLLFNVQAQESAKKVEFKLPTLSQGQTYESPKDKKKLVTFFASWCTACQKEVPLLKKLKAQAPANYEFLAINAGESDQKIKKYLSRYDAGFLVLKDVDISFSKSLGIFELPWNMIVDEKGEILYQGHQPPDKLL